jgi:T5SS/PEP-CTERM-associated repeat protein
MKVSMFLASAVCLALVASSAPGTVDVTGTVTPDPPFQAGVNLFIGGGADGSLTATDESALECAYLDMGNGAYTAELTLDNSNLTATRMYLGQASGPTVNVDILNGSAVTLGSGTMTVAPDSNSTATVNVDASTITGGCVVGSAGNGTLNITNGAAVSSGYTVLGDKGPGTVTIDGAGSKLISTGSSLTISKRPTNVLYNTVIEITNGGLMQANSIIQTGGTGVCKGEIDMATGGMLTVKGVAADITDLLTNLVKPKVAGDTLTVNYWDGATYANITGATAGVDYTLTNDTVSTTLTVVPEPATMSLLAIGGLMMLRRRR